MSNPSGRRRAARANRSTASVSMSARMGPPTSIINQSSSGRFAVSGSDRSIRVKGTEFIRVLVMPDTITSGTVLFSTPNVAGPMNTRLANFAAIFERWRPYKYNYRYVPSVPTTVAGSIILASDPDVSALYPDGSTSNIPRLTSLTGHRMTALWQPAVCGIASSADYTSLWTTDESSGETSSVDARFDAAGQFVACIVTPPGSSFDAGTSIGSLELEYDIEFFRPRLALSEAAGEAAELIMKVPIETFPQLAMTTSEYSLARAFSSLKTGAFTVGLGGLAAVLANKANTRVLSHEIKRELRSVPPPVSSSSSSVSSSSSSASTSVSVGTIAKSQPLSSRRVGVTLDNLMDVQGFKPGTYDVEIWSGLSAPNSGSGNDQLLSQSNTPTTDVPDDIGSVGYLSGSVAQDFKGDYSVGSRNARSEFSFFGNIADTNNRVQMPSGEVVRIAAMRKVTFTVRSNREFAAYDIPLYWNDSYDDLHALGAICNIIVRTRAATRLLDLTGFSGAWRERGQTRERKLPPEPPDLKVPKVSPGSPALCFSCQEPLGFDVDTNSFYCTWCEARRISASSSSSSRPLRVVQK
jgi:hypothetical protein